MPRNAVRLDAKTSRAFLNQYCVSCHNTKAPQPASHPVDLEKASLDNVLADAETWERVLRKLSVRAMPPQNMPRPKESDYVGFTTWLANSLDRAWAARGTSPGRYVVHRLNRTEYGNAIRDLLALDVDVTSLLPSDDADFGFDNIAASLKTSPMLLDRYVTAAQRISTLAVGNPKALPGTAEYSISREFSQNAYIEGLPLGTRGGTVVRHIFPADGEYKLAARLFRGVEEGYVGVEGNDTPHTFVITIDGDEVFSTTIGGPKDHEEQAKSLTEMKPVIDARMTARVKVTAGPHDVGFTWRERPAQRQDVWQPALRDSQEIHMVGGMPKIRTATDRRTVQRHRCQRLTQPRPHLRVPACQRCRRSCVRHAHPHQPDPPRVPAARYRGRRAGASRLLQAGPAERRNVRCGHPRRPGPRAVEHIVYLPYGKRCARR